jgi:hypothetical protein
VVVAVVAVATHALALVALVVGATLLHQQLLWVVLVVQTLVQAVARVPAVRAAVRAARVSL